MTGAGAGGNGLRSGGRAARKEATGHNGPFADNVSARAHHAVSPCTQTTSRADLLVFL